MIAALYVETNGAYYGLEGVDPWDEARDARKYAGPHPVVAHPPCQRWGRFWHGSTRKPHQYKLGDDGGCFAKALFAVRKFGWVLEHPADSRAWDVNGLSSPPRSGGWHYADFLGGWTCYVEQGFYGHASRKPTWLYAHAGYDYDRDGPDPRPRNKAFLDNLPPVTWGRGEQRLPQWMIDRYGYEKARRIGVVAMIGGKDKTRIRNMTPEPFRDLLIDIARSACRQEQAA